MHSTTAQYNIFVQGSMIYCQHTRNYNHVWRIRVLHIATAAPKGAHVDLEGCKAMLELLVSRMLRNGASCASMAYRGHAAIVASDFPP